MKPAAWVVGLLLMAASAVAAQPGAAPGRAAELLREARELRPMSRSRALSAAQQAAAAAMDAGQVELEIQALLFVGDCHAALNRMGSAKEVFTQALDRSRQAGSPRWMAESLFRIARTEVSTNRSAQGIERYLEALRQAEAAGDRELVATITDLLGVAHYMLRNYERAMTLCRQAEPILSRSANRALAADNLEHLGIIYTGEERWTEALTYFRRTLEIREPLGDPLALAGTLGNITLALNGMKRPREALVPIDRAIELAKGSEDPRIESYLRVRRARVLQALGRTADAERDFEQALAIDRTLGNNRRLASTLTAIAGFYRTLPGQEARALSALDEAIALNRTVYDEETTSRVNEMQETYDAERRQRQIELLERDKAIAQLEAVRDRQFRIATAVVSLLLVAGLAFALIRYRAEARTAAQLRDALHNVRTLQGLLPICSHCKKIRNDDGYWQQVESYIGQRSDARFSHGICPDCAQEHYPGLLDEDKAPTSA